MRHLRYVALLAAAASATLLTSCGEDEKPNPVRTYNMGDKVAVGHITYVVYETQWMTHLGPATEARVPQNRFFLVRMSAVNGANTDVIVPNFTIEDDNGNSYPELGGDQAQGVPQYIGYLRRVKPAETVQGHALFDAPPRHYKLKLLDENSDQMAYVDIPLSFTSESSEVPQVSDPADDQQKPVAPRKK